MSVVDYEAADHVATITLNRPEALNTMSDALQDEALAAFEEAASDDAIRAVILTGAGRAFCAGGDLNAIAGAPHDPAAPPPKPQPIEANIAVLRRRMRSSQLLREMPKVTIAAVNGACAGAGLAWACACDIRYASEAAVFNTAFMTAGLSGDYGASWTLQRIVGPAKARELILMAEKFRAPEALDMGLVTNVVPAEDLMSFVRERALRIANLAPLTIRAAKQNLNDALKLDFSALLDLEAERHIRTSRTADARESARAFLEKRAPVFQGR